MCVIGLGLTASIITDKGDVETPVTESISEEVESVSVVDIVEVVESEITDNVETESKTDVVKEVKKTEKTKKVERVETTETTETAEKIDKTDGSKTVKFKVTAYCPCKKCSADWGRMTSTGVLATQGRTIAVDPRYYPYGTKITINGNTYIAEDCGGAIKGNRIDIYFDSHQEALEFGVQYLEGVVDW